MVERRRSSRYLSSSSSSTTAFVLLILVGVARAARWGDQRKLSELDGKVDTFVPLEHSDDGTYAFHTTGIITQIGESVPPIGTEEEGVEDGGSLMIDRTGVQLRGASGEKSSAAGCLDCQSGFVTVSEGSAVLGSVKPISAASRAGEDSSDGNEEKVEADVEPSAAE